jgi:ribose transport system permease protein
MSDFDLRRYLGRRDNTTTITVWIALLALIVFGLLRYENFGGATTCRPSSATTPCSS